MHHAVPDRLTGTTLEPLARLRTTAPTLYDAAISKYDDDPSRRNIPRRRVAKLDCIYADVVNLSPLSPMLIRARWCELGVELGPVRWFAIPVDRLRGLPAVVTIPDRQSGVGADLGDDAVAWFDPDAYHEFTDLPVRTAQWYARLASAGKQGAWFVGVPHILVKGSISIAGLRPIDWCRPEG